MEEIKEIYVKIAEVKKGFGSMKLKSTLGSCVAIVFYDRVRKQSAVAHCLLPEGDTEMNVLSARYVKTGIRSLKVLMAVDESNKANIDVKVVGGANMMSEVFKAQSGQVGIKNGLVALELLHKEGFEVKFQDLGGEFARQIVVWNESGELEVITLNKGLIKTGTI